MTDKDFEQWDNDGDSYYWHLQASHNEEDGSIDIDNNEGDCCSSGDCSITIRKEALRPFFEWLKEIMENETRS